MFPKRNTCIFKTKKQKHHRSHGVCVCVFFHFKWKEGRNLEVLTPGDAEPMKGKHKNCFEQAYPSCQCGRGAGGAKKLLQKYSLLTTFFSPTVSTRLVNKIPSESLSNNSGGWENRRGRGWGQEYLTILTATNQIFDFAHVAPFENTHPWNKDLIQIHQKLVRVLWTER